MIIDISEAQLASNHYVSPPPAIELQFEPDAFLCKIVAALGRKVTSETPSFYFVVAGHLCLDFGR